MRDLMQAQKKDWAVDYNSNESSPLTKKLTAMDDLVSFRVQLFGGVIEVIAHNYTVASRDEI
jgi:hypothetical protein